MSVALTQEMVDTWCNKRESEVNRSQETRTRVVRLFVDYLRRRGLTDVAPPAKCKPESKTYIPYAFDDDELVRFFHACDSYQPFHFRKKQSILKKFTVPVFFRLLYSTGMRTTEARLLKKDNVDLVHGVIDIQESKGYDQHYVVMHDSMKSLMVKYDQAIAKVLPVREYFFQTSEGTHYTRDWVQDNFRQFWNESNDGTVSPVAYDLRHHYAIININSWLDDGFEFNDKLQYLSKSMGHRSIEATRYYYSIVPRLSDTLTEKTEVGFNLIVPEVSDEEE
jgi:integrase